MKILPVLTAEEIAQRDRGGMTMDQTCSEDIITCLKERREEIIIEALSTKIDIADSMSLTTWLMLNDELNRRLHPLFVLENLVNVMLYHKIIRPSLFDKLASSKDVTLDMLCDTLSDDMLLYQFENPVDHLTFAKLLNQKIEQLITD